MGNRGKGPYSPTPADESDGDDDGHDDVEGSTASSKGKYNQKGGSRTGGKSTGKNDASWKGACDTGDHGNHGKGNQGKPSSVAAAAAAAAASLDVEAVRDDDARGSSSSDPAASETPAMWSRTPLISSAALGAPVLAPGWRIPVTPVPLVFNNMTPKMPPPGCP